MAAPRLPFLYPHLFKSLLCHEGQYSGSLARSATPLQPRQIHTTRRREQESYSQRYGPAADPSPPPPHVFQKPEGTMSPAQAGKDVRPTPEKGAELKPKSFSKEEHNVSQPKTDTKSDAVAFSDLSRNTEIPLRSAVLDAAESHPKETVSGPRTEAPDKALETVLHMEAPTAKKTGDDHKTHLHAPPYVHHFDTYTLVKDLAKGGFTQDQSITIMKAVRSLLAVNLDVAKEELVSKSDIENETYLFRAACSELRTEIQNTRKSSSEKMRTERAHLQHEMDILNQKLTQDSATLKDDLKGMFNDRKMAVRMEQRAMDSGIQELNYKITVALNSDSRGEVEGLRWVLTRRAAMAIAGMAFLILGSLRYSSYMIHLQDEERKKMATRETSTSTDSGSGSYTTPSRSTSTQTGGDSEAMIANMDSGNNASYVSLG